MFTLPATGGAEHRWHEAGDVGVGRGVRFGRRQSRVRGLPEFFGELPVVALAEEIETPGDGQIRALITVAGNPVLSTPERRPPRPRARVARLHGLGRHLPQRDDAPRQRDPPGARVCSPAATTTSRCTRSRCATSPTTRRRSSSSSPTSSPSGRSCSASPASSPGRASTAEAAATLDDFVLTSQVQKAVTREGSNVEGRDAGELFEALSVERPPRSRARPRPHAAHRPVRRRLRRRSRTGSRSRCSRRTRTASTSARSSRASPRCCARRAARSSSRRR